MSQRTVLITGASRGIGLALAEAYATGGDEVIAVIRETSDAGALEAVGGSVTIHRADVTSEESLADLVDRMTGAIDILINNAGIMADGESIENLSSEQLIDHYMINSVAPALVTKAMLPLLRKSDAGMIVNISSSFASLELKNPNMPARYSYSMSKAAINMFSKTLAFELADLAITVVALHPGWTRTGIGGSSAQLAPEESASAIVETLDGLTPDRSGEFIAWTGKVLPW